MGRSLSRPSLRGYVLGDVVVGEHKVHTPKVHWHAPSQIIGFLALGFSVALTHHLFARSRHGQVVKGTDQQELYLQICTGLAILTRTLLSFVVIISYTQRQWRILKRKPKTVKTLDGLFSVLYDIFMFRHVGIWSGNWSLLFLALVKWLLVLPTIFTPATLSVDTALAVCSMRTNVPTLNFMTGGWSQDGHPHPIVQSLTISSAVEGEILSITPPATNCSYTTSFYAPALRCQRLENVTVFPNPPEFAGAFNASYFSWTGDYSLWNSSEQALDTPFGHSNDRSSISVWIAVSPDVLGCVLYNASHTTTFNFKAGKQDVAVRIDQYLDRVEYLTIQDNSEDTRERTAYYNLMTAIGQVLVGHVGTEMIIGGQKRETSKSTLILATKLGLEHATNAPMVEQLFANMTLSVLHSSFVQKPPETANRVDVTVHSSEIVYNYNQRWLFLSYGLGFGFTVISAAIGLTSIHQNAASYTNKFSTILRVTRGTEYDAMIADEDRQGQEPVPKHIREQRLSLNHRENG